MKSILCPIDFSETAISGLEYAANLAKLMSARLNLIYVRTSIWPEAKQLEYLANLSAREITVQLKGLCEETANEFNISCDSSFETTVNTLDEILATESKKHDLTVMGTNGVDSFYKFLFGSNSYHLIEKTKCPILLVPRNYVFKPIRRVVFAYDPETNPIFLIDQFKLFAEALKAAAIVLHIAEEKSQAEAEHMTDILHDAVLVRKPKFLDWQFDAIISKDVPWSLHHYMKAHDVDVLALSFHHRSLTEKLFTPNVVRDISLMAEYPVFVFWH